jgi:hypothetical protein
MVMIFKNISPGVYNITVYVSPENLLLGEKYGWLTSLVFPLCIEQYDFILEGVQPASITMEETDTNLTVTVSGPISLFITYTPYGDNVTVIEDPDDSPYLYDYDGDGFCSYSIWRACHASGSFNGYPLEPANFNYGGFDIVDYEWYNLGILAPTVVTTVDFAPSTLNLKSKGKWITAYIETPEGYNVHEINVSTIMLNDTILVEPRPISIGDYDSDSIPDLMIKFDRQAVIQYILNNIDIEQLFEERFMTITLTITGKLNDGTPFQGSDTIRIILPMPKCWRLLAKLGIYPF